MEDSSVAVAKLSSPGCVEEIAHAPVLTGIKIPPWTKQMSGVLEMEVTAKPESDLMGDKSKVLVIGKVVVVMPVMV